MFLSFIAESDNVVIDTTILEKLLHALDARSVSGWYHPAMRMQNELIASKEREYALKERIRISETILAQNDRPDRPIPKERLSLKTQQNKNPSGNDVGNLTKIDTSEHRFNQFDSLFQHISDLETDLENNRVELKEAVEKQRERELKIEEMKIYESQFVELTESIKSNDETKELLLAEQQEQVVQLKNAINHEEKKMRFCQEDYECLRKLHKHTKDKQNRLIFELRKELIETRKMIAEIEMSQRKIESADPSDKDELVALRHELNYLRRKTSHLNSCIVTNLKTLDGENEMELNYDRIEKLGVVRNNFVVDFITKTEYEEIDGQCKILTQRNEELTVHSNHLEQLLNLLQEQV